MGWDLITWGLFIGIVGMAWMMVLAITGDPTDRETPGQSSKEAPGGTTGHRHERGRTV